ncbi:hypothetical protein TNCV_3870681 [Trichonephila clavipes]|nr:hypothetical protein TNCV_3870681 [Trichonephila clavipes]
MALEQGWADFSRVRATSNFFKLLRPSQCQWRPLIRTLPHSPWGCGIPLVKAVTPKCLGGPPVDRDRRNAYPGFREKFIYLKRWRDAATRLKVNFFAIDGRFINTDRVIVTKTLAVKVTEAHDNH